MERLKTLWDPLHDNHYRHWIGGVALIFTAVSYALVLVDVYNGGNEDLWVWIGGVKICAFVAWWMYARSHRSTVSKIHACLFLVMALLLFGFKLSRS